MKICPHSLFFSSSPRASPGGGGWDFIIMGRGVPLTPHPRLQHCSEDPSILNLIGIFIFTNIYHVITSLISLFILLMTLKKPKPPKCRSATFAIAFLLWRQDIDMTSHIFLSSTQCFVSLMMHCIFWSRATNYNARDLGSHKSTFKKYTILDLHV